MKRLADIFIALTGIFFTAPLLAFIAVWIKVDSSGPVFFRQTRVGKNGKPFTILKYRTMTVDAEKSGYYTAENDSRITRAGAFLRKTSLDELPQLFNILKGEMSVVGPRPTLAYQVEQYDEFQKRRLEVKPGVTGWAQVNGRNSLSWPERITYDVWYVDNYSFSLDIRILYMTVFVWLRGEGLYAEKDKFKLSDDDDAHL
jgi:undecaprenyl phosphate N,N'-diacetylbacillosamine 1-phosphate transferase